MTDPAASPESRIIGIDCATVAKKVGLALCSVRAGRPRIDQLKQTLAIIGEGESNELTYIIENFERLITPFAETLELFPVSRISVITGAEGRQEPISAIHPNAVAMERNNMIAGAISEALSKQPKALSGEAAEEGQEEESKAD